MSALSTTVGPPAPEVRQWLTLAGRKRVLAVAHTVAYTKRLLDVLSLLEADFRLQVVFTVPPHVFGDEVPRFLAGLGSKVLAWEDAVRTTFDLALAAGPRGVERLDAPLITLPHGAGYLKRVTGTADDGVAGMRRRDLVPGGRLPAAVVLPHHAELRELRRHCPEAVPVAHVVGDPVHDRITASLDRRAAYRRALGLRDGERLVVTASTWGPRSSFGLFEALLPRLMGELSGGSLDGSPGSSPGGLPGGPPGGLPGGRFRTAVLLHPNVWSGHGAWQVRSWLARCAGFGIAVVPPEADWRSVLIAADWIIGDHGSVTLYGALTQAPLLLASSPDSEINPASPAAQLALAAPALSPAYPLVEQLEYAATGFRHEERRAVAARITSEPGRFNRNMRRLMYRVLGLGEPAHEPETVPLPMPAPLDAWTAGRGEVPA